MASEEMSFENVDGRRTDGRRTDDGRTTDACLYYELNKHLLFPELWPFENLGILNLSARYLRKYLS